jgi:hypothetical protein
VAILFIILDPYSPELSNIILIFNFTWQINRFLKLMAIKQKVGNGH